jgi:hypothetical protein
LSGSSSSSGNRNNRILLVIVVIVANFTLIFKLPFYFFLPIMKQIAGFFICSLGILFLSGDLSAQTDQSFSAGHKMQAIRSYALDNPDDSRWFWDFNRWDDREGWTLPDILTGKVSGGSLWLTIQTETKAETVATWKDQIWGSAPDYVLVSPKGLMIPAAQYNKIVIRLRNLSPETDGFIRWQRTEKPGVDTGSVHFTMKPDCNEWQEVICHMDNKWKGNIDRIKILPAQMWRRGDIWIDWISVTKGEVKKASVRPDICSDRVIPLIRLPGIQQRDFGDAFRVLDECLVSEVPVNGFTYAFLAPGGAYGTNWWQLDASLNIAGAKWADQSFVEDMMRGFAGVQAQNPDGRIDLWGGSTTRGQSADVSSLPRYFEAAYDVARRSKDSSVQNLIYATMKKYLGYWFSKSKRDQVTGLITGVFEETLSNAFEEVGSVAPIDLNVAVAIGCYNTGRLAGVLGNTTESERFLRDFEELSASINRYLWNDEKKLYYNYNVREKKQDQRLLCSTFDPMRLGIAGDDRVMKLIPALTDPSLFYWGKRPLTTIARSEPGYLEATGPYDGRAWFGDIWTLRNLPVIKGLEDVGKHELAAELAWSTIKTFNANYHEFIVPANGSGEGVERYGWSASQYIQAIIEDLFGIDYDSYGRRLRIAPHIPAELLHQEIAIQNLKIPTQHDLRLSLKILQKEKGRATLTLALEGELPDEMIEICLPDFGEKRITVKDSKGKVFQTAIQPEGMKNMLGVRIKMKDQLQITFE